MADMTREERDEILALAEYADHGAESCEKVPGSVWKKRAEKNRKIARALRLLAEGEKGEPVARGWLAISDEARSGERILLLWAPIGGLKEHIELGWWSSAKGTWTNTYGKSFSGEPDAWAPLAPFAPPARSYADGVEDPVRTAALAWHQAGQDLHAAIVEGRNSAELQNALYAAEERLNLACRALAPKEG
jgi:hypothetical protein